MAKYSLRLGHLYPKLLNIYGDYGNVLALKNRCMWRGIELEIEEINVGDRVVEHDIYFMGGGQDAQQIIVSKELQNVKDDLKLEQENGAVFLAICGGYQLLGRYYQPQQGEKLLGAELLDIYTIAGEKRFIGNVTSRVDFLKPNSLVGFENHSGLTYLQGETKPLSKVVIGRGNNGQDKTEGARYKNVFGTYLHGALLPKNPHFADYLISLALEKKYGEKIELPTLDDKLEISAHKAVINKPY